MHIEKIDFSQFHPLFHQPFTRECRSYYGGSRQHLRLAWEFVWWPALRGVPYRALCRFGVHREQLRWREENCWVACEYCTFRRAASAAEAERGKLP